MSYPISGTMNLHSVTAVEFVRLMPENSNALTMRFKTGDGYSDFTLTVFNLPDEAANALADALRSLAPEPVKEPEAV